MKYIGYKDEQELLLVRGHPGSGKTTMANLFEMAGYSHFENDAFFTNDEGQYNFRFEDHQRAKDVCLRDTKKDLDKGFKVVVSNTFTKLSEMQPFIDYATDRKIPVRVIEMELNFDNVHDVPEQVVIDKKKQFEHFENAMVIDTPDFNIVREEEVKVRQFDADTGVYDGTGAVPKHHVAESLNKLDITIKYFEDSLTGEYDREYIENQENDIKSLKNIRELIKEGNPEKISKAVRSLDTMVRDDIPNDLFILLGGNIHKEKFNSARFNEMSPSTITNNFYEVVRAYKEDPDKGKIMDAAFTDEYFKDAEMILSYEKSRNKVLGY